MYQILLTIAPKAVPLPLEAYLAFHFKKVRKQTLLYMQDYMNASPDPSIQKLLHLMEGN